MRTSKRVGCWPGLVADPRGRKRLLGLESRGAIRQTYTVNRLVDSPDANPGDGISANSSGASTLRAAIMEANTTPAANTINFNNVNGELTLLSALPDLSTLAIKLTVFLYGLNPMEQIKSLQ